MSVEGRRERGECEGEEEEEKCGEEGEKCVEGRRRERGECGGEEGERCVWRGGGREVSVEGRRERGECGGEEEGEKCGEEGEK